ncbi:hypothetical protein PICMEDRAFT_15361 [Pichia membranifaciens NRRL Y-2026]|uniref:Uncharacterized protein n=1 Tax=Pichia membranifaciens NRRL Y-2026 TaxID=763406 RepID=A0A1E3NMR6_9ASCO|nr:hypothetical protein PICMEDRAFT_15361 [Pichia membranifaciens NRRL Y-2026]ODQ47412.1 hypothetical protein PICMEDRAFT_15361 [Pichia membranifaciens NRRL Y-2026]
MNNLLESAADNIFITSANVLDTLTYRFSNTATKVTIPNNNDSLTAPLTEQLAKDYDTFNQVLNDYGMDLSNCVYILNSMKTKNQKEKVIKAKREQQRLEEERLRLIKEKEDMEKKERFAKENAQKQSAQLNGENGLTQVDSNGHNSSSNNNIDLFNMGSTPASTTNTNGRTSGGNSNGGNDGDDMMLDLDLDNFNFDGTGADMMNFDFNDPMSMGSSDKGNLQGVKSGMNTNRTSHNSQSSNTNANASGMANLNLSTNLNTNNNANTNQNANLNTSTNATSTNANSGANEYFNFGQDSDLADLNLDFLQDDEMGNLMQNMAVDGGGSGNSKNENEMNDDALAADQMEQLFSQFDEMVGNGI